MKRLVEKQNVLMYVQRLTNNLKTSQTSKKKLQISYEAFLLDDEINLCHKERIANQMNGFIIKLCEHVPSLLL